MQTTSPTGQRAPRLVACLVNGAIDDDLVQLHGAIVASLELYRVADAVEVVSTRPCGSCPAPPAPGPASRSASSSQRTCTRPASSADRQASRA